MAKPAYNGKHPGGSPRITDEAHDQYLRVRLTETDKRAIERAAARANTQVATWVRDILIPAAHREGGEG